MNGSDPQAWASIELLRVTSAYPLSPESRVIIATDRPEDYSHVAPLIILLSLSALLFAFILLRPLLSELLRPRNQASDRSS